MIQHPISALSVTRGFPLSLFILVIGVLFQEPALAQAAEKKQAPEARLQPGAFRVHDREGLSRKHLSDGDILSIKTARLEESFVVDLGPLEVEPGIHYSAGLTVESGENENPVGVMLMIREHPGVEKAPFQPYHKTQLPLRPLAPNTADRRELNFVTGENTRALSVTIQVSHLLGEIKLSAFELSLATPTGRPVTPEEGKAVYETLMKEIRAAADARKPLTSRPLVFSRSQMKYPLGRNYYHEWNDRPLLVDRKYRLGSEYPTPLPSYERTLAEVKKYEIDGLAFFPETSSRLQMFKAHREAKVKEVGLLTEFLPTDDAKAIADKIQILRMAMDHPASPRIDGKVVVTSYGAESLSAEKWGVLLSALRKELGETFLFLPSLTNVADLRKTFLAGDPISRADVEKQRDVLRAYLDVCDGIYFNYPAAFKLKDHTFDEKFYRDVFIPVFKSVLSEPAYQRKYLGLSAYKSHMSPERGNSLHEDGTRTLRRSFEAAMDARPDLIILPEWDEENENTSFRPTLYGGRTTERILRYYMSRIKGKAPTPIPGDDPEVPNLILSSRKMVTLGEEAVFELLNVPDSTRAGKYTVELKLENAEGKVVHSFPEREFDTLTLQEHRFSLPTETLPDVVALIPTLSIRGYREHSIDYRNGFHHVAVRATWNWDHLFVKQALRDLLRPEKASFSAAAPVDESADDDSFVLTGSVRSPESLSLIEVLGDDDEVYAVDPNDEFFRNDPTKERLVIEYRAINRQDIKGTITLSGATADWFSNGPPLKVGEFDSATSAQQVGFNRSASVHQQWIYLAIPKSAVAGSELSFEVDKKGRFTVPVRDVFEKQMIAHGMDGGIHLSIKPYRRQIDMPVSLEKLETEFRVRVWPEIATEQFHLRLTSASGKTYRSRPILLPSSGSGQRKSLRVFSEAHQKPIDLEVSGERIPSLDFDFNPERGAILLNDAGRPFWATLGGFSNSTTGRGTVNGLFGSKYPTGVKRSDPAWVKDEEGGDCLEFDGEGTYLELPRESIPFHGAFTLSFDVKPKTGEDQYLFINGAVTRQHGLALQIQDGNLHASFLDSDGKSHQWQTELPLPAGAWSSIQLSRDFENLVITVNHKTESFPLTRPAFNTGFTVFGAGWKGQPFAGRLRALRIEHNSPEQKDERPR